MNIGYACLAVGVEGTDQKSCISRNATEEKLAQLIAHNLDALENIIDYNCRNNIRMFRISSDLVPFGSSPVNTLDWSLLFAGRFAEIGRKILAAGIRVSMHPGQYTVLNSPDAGVVSRAIDDLAYHARLLDALGVDQSHKIILHVGGIYHDKDEAVKRFKTICRLLDDTVKRRLVLENDDKAFTICDLLEIGASIGLPVVYDNLHNRVNPCDGSKTDAHWISACKDTWQRQDGTQKVHYSQQDPAKRPGSHSQSIGIAEFMQYLEGLGREDLDIMLEVKDKNLSAVKCILCTASGKEIRLLEEEWGRYKYKILENAPEEYLAIRKLLADKNAYPAVRFYELVESALRKPASVGNSVNAAQHVWGYFKDCATDKEKLEFMKSIDMLQSGSGSAAAVKRMLHRMAAKYDQRYLLDSYYFIL